MNSEFNENNRDTGAARNGDEKPSGYQGNRNYYNKKRKQRHFGSPSQQDNPRQPQRQPVRQGQPNRQPGQSGQTAQAGQPGQTGQTGQQQKQPIQQQQNQQPRPVQSNIQPQQNYRPNQQNQQNQQRQPQVQNPRKWENRVVKIEESYEDIKRDNERIEKEIWLEIAEIHNMKLE